MKMSLKSLFVAAAVAFTATACGQTKTTETTTAADGTTTATVVTDSTMTATEAGAKLDAKMEAAGAKIDAAGAKLDAKMNAAGVKIDAMGDAAAKSAAQAKENMKEAVKK